MKNFKKDFELRRIIFGLSAIIKTPEANLPQLVNDKIPGIMLELSSLVKKMHDIRSKNLKKNQKWVENGGADPEDYGSEGPDDVG